MATAVWRHTVCTTTHQRTLEEDMLTEEQRAAVVGEAKSWVGTPYVGCARLKGHGVDCGQLLYGVYLNAGLIPELELPKNYSIQVAQHRTSPEYRNLVDKLFEIIPESAALPGDVVLYKLGKDFAHGAIIVEWPGYVIQAEARHGVSGAHGSNTKLFRHAPREFRTLRAGLKGAE
jgi:cell wall-associated NlpC family hydrolase